MFKFVATVFAAILALASAAPKPGVIGAPLAYSSVYGGPVVSAYSPYSSPIVSAYSAPVVSTYGAAPLAYSAYRAPGVAYIG